MIKQSLNRKIKIFITLLTFLMISGQSFGQTYLFFQDSPANDLYDFSWMELTPPSELTRMGADLRKFPVEAIIPAIQGTNSLRLRWKSVSGGDWVAIAAPLNWANYNISDTDTLLFWLRSTEGLNKNNLPKIFLEDSNNVKTTKHIFSNWCPNLNSGVWTRVAIPMSLFFNYGDPVDFTRIKTTGFAQNVADGVSHTLLVDDMRIFKGDGSSPPASQPTGVIAEGFDSHVEILWNPNPEAFINGYQVQRTIDNGNNWVTSATVDKNTTRHIDWTRPLGVAINAQYRIRALNSSNQPSEPSVPANSSTRIFTDDELLEMVQKYTFRYFSDFAHPVSGMSRERNTSDNVVTTGGSGFGIMALTVGIERGFISREAGIAQMLKIISFLETADRYHGVWPHWLNGNTGRVIPFSEFDNGGDLVETAFLVQGLLIARQYFNESTQTEQQIVSRITALWESVEWDWYSRNNSGALYWHWSPNYGWQMNMEVRGWNEAAMVYLLAIASPTHPVSPSYWNNGWAGMPSYINGRSFYGYILDVGWDRGGPLFFAQYSFLGFDPRNIKDNFTNYFNLNRNHTLIHRAYSIQNPQGHTGYGPNCWGLTASDDPFGYQVHEPVSGRDNGTITPTAALSSMPYTPDESLAALKHFYRELGDKTWGWMGFYDAFNQRENWWATSYLAIDQGPIIGMIENYRSGLLWTNFMANPEIEPMLNSIGFVPDPFDLEEISTTHDRIGLYPNPSATGYTTLSINATTTDVFDISIVDVTGKKISYLPGISVTPPGEYRININTSDLGKGMYLISVNGVQQNYSRKLFIQ
ncbi:MAG: T9SS type A sorting domain-containing protein [Lentimicrobium sp.]|nr:T9SS type A sorting domain-containing protein [Lentimicrobium sp.]